MLNKFPLWKNILILLVIAFGFIYATPNFYPPDPAIQLSGQSGAMVIDGSVLQKVEGALGEAGIDYFDGQADGESLLVRLNDINLQLRAKEVIQAEMAGEYIVALNLAPTTPDWLSSLGGQPMKLGLDLRGGVHFLLEVDLASAIAVRLESDLQEIKTVLRKEKIRYRSFELKGNQIIGQFRDVEQVQKATALIRNSYRDLLPETSPGQNPLSLVLNLSIAASSIIEDSAIKQNLTSLRNRVNELGVSEPLVSRQGKNRIVVELPGVQDTAEAKRIIGKTANLEFRFESQGKSGERFEFKTPRGQGPDAELEKKSIITGENVIDAQPSFDQNGRPQVRIRLDGGGAVQMGRATRDNVGRRLGVLFIEYKTKLEKTIDENGELVITPVPFVEQHVISLATVQSQLGKEFVITGLEQRESSELALLLRAGALAAPMYIVEERTIGPSLGADNIDLGVKSVTFGMAMVLLFMVVVYRAFGLAANVALTMNLLLLVAFMSLLGATLTLPGIAGIVLTVGMAVDANVLIFSRIREERNNGATVQGSISAGYDRAFVSILDANITTLIVALILFLIGSGPVQGFAVTLSIGILTSMFTSIVMTRGLVNLVVGGRKIEKLWI
ncbi:MAG: protein translocase subunit SecD [Porticoccaceae bacterium]|jgi:preprotein translocase subunit SecD|nr:protein translocase subunit SecD [Porticoccaceae bacterium]MBT4590844.1 protein translocase subunit SecD [Porticoccaceae bacterium]MBT5004181.1 protein translocase subunit SecD [Porticoccaceae bacterium]MBT5103538.1 protein translocase subunit SecD [Porticoccaceae bacterium]MBT6027490.1 protein translocase subunit SecD [Porticoccaceae bacterium]